VCGFLTEAFQRNYFQTLVHLAVTTLWVLPVVAAGPGVRVGYAVLSGVLHVWLSSRGYYDWVMGRPGIDGGPLGFLTWTIPFLAGSLAYDLTTFPPGRRAFRLAVAGAVLMVLGYALSCLYQTAPPNGSHAAGGLAVRLAAPPGVRPDAPADLWTMSQRAGSVSYQTFAAGFAVATYALFVLACDGGRFRSGVFQTLGGNALAAYLIHGIVDNAMTPYLPKDAPPWFAVLAFVVFAGVCLVFVRYLDKHRIYLRL
jgi:hypothetical protein